MKEDVGGGSAEHNALDREDARVWGHSYVRRQLEVGNLRAGERWGGVNV